MPLSSEQSKPFYTVSEDIAKRQLILKPVWSAGHMAVMQPLVARPAQRQQIFQRVCAAVGQFNPVVRGEFRPLVTPGAGEAECGAEIEPFGDAEMLRGIALVAGSASMSRCERAGRSPSDAAIPRYIFVAFGVWHLFKVASTDKGRSRLLAGYDLPRSTSGINPLLDFVFYVLPGSESKNVFGN